MKKPRGTIRAQRSAEIRAKWAAHLAAQQASGLRQSEYCRESGVDAKYFSRWKGRLAREAAGHAEPMALVPVVLTAATSDKVTEAGERRSRPARPTVGLASLSLHVTLPNGIALGFELVSLGALPGPSLVKWKLFAALSNAAAAIVLGRLCLAVGLSEPIASMSVWTAAFGFGSLYTLYDPFSSDPLMYLLGPLLTLLLLTGRFATAGWIAMAGVLAKEFAAVPLFMFTLAAAIKGQWTLMLRVLAFANAALIVWVALQFILMLRYNYSYGDSHSVQLGSGGYLMHWLSELSPRGAASALANEFGALWLLAPVGLLAAPPALRRLAFAAIPPALLFAYVQQPDRALWNFHYLVIPAGLIVVSRLPSWWPWVFVGCFAFANLRLGAQLTFVPAARLALAASAAMAVVAIVQFARAPRSAVVLTPREALTL